MKKTLQMFAWIALGIVLLPLLFPLWIIGSWAYTTDADATLN